VHCYGLPPRNPLRTKARCDHHSDLSIIRADMVGKKIKSKVQISIVTATYNAAKPLRGLIESLRKQTDKDFEWVVADGASEDDTLELMQSIDDLDIVISSQPDFGIYDALNRAIRKAAGDYYIVAGADDVFDPDAIASFRRAVDSSGADIVTADVLYCGQRKTVKKSPAWLIGHVALITAHSLGTAFRKDLHRSYGFYSRKFPIAADQLFVMNACKGGASRHVCDFLAGEIGSGGVSSLDRVGNATEVFRVQLDIGHSRFIQTILLIIRLLR